MADTIYDDEQYRLALAKLAADQAAVGRAQAKATPWERFTTGAGAAGRQSRGLLGQVIGAITGAFPGPTVKAQEQVDQDLSQLRTPLDLEKARLGVLGDRARTGEDIYKAQLPALQDRQLSDADRAKMARTISGAAAPMVTEPADYSDLPVDDQAADQAAAEQLRKLFPQIDDVRTAPGTRQVPWRGPRRAPTFRTGAAGTEVWDPEAPAGQQFSFLPHPAAATPDRTREGELGEAMKFYTSQGESPRRARRHAAQEVERIHGHFGRTAPAKAIPPEWMPAEQGAAYEKANPNWSVDHVKEVGRDGMVRYPVRTRAMEAGEEPPRPGELPIGGALPPVKPAAGGSDAGMLGNVMRGLFGAGTPAPSTPAASRAAAAPPAASVRAGPYDDSATPSFATEEDAQAAAERGEIQDGDEIVVGGQRARWQE